MELIRTGKTTADSFRISTRGQAEHGGNIYKIAEEIGIPEDKLIDFSASINPLGLSDKVKDAIKKELNNLTSYPDPDTKKLRQKIARHHDIAPESVLCGNGSTELIYLIPRALKPEKVLVTAPTFSEYERAITGAQNLPAGQAGAEHPEKKNRGAGRTQTEALILKKSNNFRIDAQEFINAMEGCDMAFLCNPNNPTGGFIKKEEVAKIAAAAMEKKCILVVDEAFIDFIPEESVIHYVQNNPCLIVLRSMTKFYALTGLRIGYGVLHKDLIGSIKDFKEPWTVNSLAQKATIAAMEGRDYIDKTMELIRHEKEFIESELQNIGIEFFPSSANFYLIKIATARKIYLELKKKGILLRDCSNFKGLDNTYIRIAVKSREDNGMLLSELAKLFIGQKL